MSCKSGMGETGVMIHPEAKYLSSCEPMDQTKSRVSKAQQWDRNGVDITIPKGSNWKEEKGQRSQTSLKPSRTNSTRF